MACSVDRALNVAVHLDPPVRLDLGPAGQVDASTVYASVDSRAALAEALLRRTGGVGPVTATCPEAVRRPTGRCPPRGSGGAGSCSEAARLNP
ncbi:hypothetical protein GCM10010343_09480 [Streptomyces avidinii]|nr:hypothetical protein GCM10010343_09480 [Streptomyces avidinii]